MEKKIINTLVLKMYVPFEKNEKDLKEFVEDNLKNWGYEDCVGFNFLLNERIIVFIETNDYEKMRDFKIILKNHINELTNSFNKMKEEVENDRNHINSNC